MPRYEELTELTELVIVPIILVNVIHLFLWISKLFTERSVAFGSRKLTCEQLVITWQKVITWPQYIRRWKVTQLERSRALRSFDRHSLNSLRFSALRKRTLLISMRTSSLWWSVVLVASRDKHRANPVQACKRRAEVHSATSWNL